MSNDLGYTVILDEACPLHGYRNVVYQYDNENFVRADRCGACAESPRTGATQQVAHVAIRLQQERPFRPARRTIA